MGTTLAFLVVCKPLNRSSTQSAYVFFNLLTVSACSPTLEPYGNLCHSYDRKLLHARRGSNVRHCHSYRDATGAPELHFTRRHPCHHWWLVAGLFLVRCPNHRGESAMWFRHRFNFLHHSDVHGRNEYRIQGARARSGYTMRVAYLRRGTWILDGLRIHQDDQSGLMALSHRISDRFRPHQLLWDDISPRYSTLVL